MPLSPPAARQPIHTRTITCKGYRRADGLFDIEGHLCDVKSYDCIGSERGPVTAGTPIHEMQIRMTVDDTLTVRAIEAVTDFSPYPATCPAISPAYQKVVGLQIGRGWTRAIKERLGGVHGCTHLTELLGPLATTAFQTVIPLLAHERGNIKAEAAQGLDFPLLNTCHSYRADGPVVKQQAPHLYTGKDTENPER